VQDEDIIVATDGSCENNGSSNAIVGAGVFYAENDRRNKSIRLPKEMLQSNQTGEAVAMKIAAEESPLSSPIIIESDSRYAIGLVTSSLQKMEDQGYIGVANSQIARVTTARLRRRKAKTRIKWVKGHNGHVRNEGADKEAAAAVKKRQPDKVNMTIEPTLKVTGAKLAKMKQSLAYKAIRAKKLNIEFKKRERTKRNIRAAQLETEREFNKKPTEESIWKAMRNKDFSRQARYFMWMAAHDAYMIGTNWLRENASLDIQFRSMCTHDGEIETMEHLLTKCSTPGQAEIWELAERLWKLRYPEWEKPDVGSIISCALAEYKDEEGTAKPGKSRLYRILVSESAHMVWKLRCERIIQNEDQAMPKEQVHNRWLKAINDRLNLDCQMTHPKYQKKALLKNLVKKHGKVSSKTKMASRTTGPEAPGF